MLAVADYSGGNLSCLPCTLSLRNFTRFSFIFESGMKYSAQQVATWFRSIAYEGYIAALADLDG